ncbi:MAG: RNA polymerase sigma-70 factor [Bacteroidetes bacterium]|nr:RNA polymerase sigma-70 factor [Bacteroidota bacterium]
MDKYLAKEDGRPGLQPDNRRILEQLFRSYYPSLFSYARILLKDASLAEDAVQDVFLKLLENHSIIIIDSTAKAYLIRAVHNYCINYLKSSEVNRRLSEEALRELKFHADLATFDLSDEVLLKLSTSELNTYLNKAIDALPQQCRQIFLLNRQASLSYTQISQKLGISYDTVKSQIMKALDRLRDAYKKF